MALQGLISQGVYKQYCQSCILDIGRLSTALHLAEININVAEVPLV